MLNYRVINRKFVYYARDTVFHSMCNKLIYITYVNMYLYLHTMKIKQINIPTISSTSAIKRGFCVLLINVHENKYKLYLSQKVWSDQEKFFHDFYAHQSFNSKLFIYFYKYKIGK